MGVPGCGKTTTFTSIAKSYNLPVFTEPEESLWPEAVKNYKDYPSGGYNLLQWFRSQRVPQWYRADSLRGSTTVLVDTCYDLLLYYYMDRVSMSWLVDKSCPYYWLLKGIAYQDQRTLPKPDCIVFFYLDRKTWLRNLEQRGRVSDRCERMRENFETLQRNMYDAAIQYCKSYGVKLIDYHVGCEDLGLTLREAYI